MHSTAAYDNFKPSARRPRPHDPKLRILVCIRSVKHICTHANMYMHVEFLCTFIHTHANLHTCTHRCVQREACTCWASVWRLGKFRQKLSESRGPLAPECVPSQVQVLLRGAPTQGARFPHAKDGQILFAVKTQEERGEERAVGGERKGSSTLFCMLAPCCLLSWSLLHGWEQDVQISRTETERLFKHSPTGPSNMLGSLTLLYSLQGYHCSKTTPCLRYYPTLLAFELGRLSTLLPFYLPRC